MTFAEFFAGVLAPLRRLLRRKAPVVPVVEAPSIVAVETTVAGSEAVGRPLAVAPVAEPAPEFAFRGNRHARRAWQRERMKRDKWVEPKGPRPVKLERGERSTVKPPELPELPEGKDGNFVMQGDDGICYAESELYGQYNFRDTILDQLDHYWVYLRRMKAKEPGAYGFYRRLGANVVPLATWLLQDGVRDKTARRIEPMPALSPWWRQHRPAFGCVCYGMSSRIEADEASKHYWTPRFLYYIKYREPPPNIQRCHGGDVYALTIWWDRTVNPMTRRKRKAGWPTEFAVFVSRDGNDVHVLPMLKTSIVSVPSRRNGLDRFDLPRRAWGIPEELKAWARSSGETAPDYLKRLFLEATQVVEETSFSMVRIEVAHRDLTAVFGVEVKRIPYFFQDRDVTLTQSGLKQRIFHIVRAHVRKDGSKVPFHFRGLRSFEWAGYRVAITVPGRDHLMLADVDIGSIDPRARARHERKGLIEMPEFGKKLADAIHQGRGGTMVKP